MSFVVFSFHALDINNFHNARSHYAENSPNQQPITARDFTGSNLCRIITTTYWLNVISTSEILDRRSERSEPRYDISLLQTEQARPISSLLSDQNSLEYSEKIRQGVRHRSCDLKKFCS